MNGSITVNNAVTEPATATTESNFADTVISGSPTWQTAVLNVKITNGTGTGLAGERLQVFYAQTTTDGLANSLPVRGCASYFFIQLPPKPSSDFYFVSPVFPVTGSTLYTWFAHDTWANARTITTTINGVLYGP